MTKGSGVTIMKSQKHETLHERYETRKTREVEEMRKAKAAAAVRPPHKSLMKQVLKHWEFYLLLLPGIIITIIFKYVPIYGVQIAFRDYNPVGGFFGSPWVGLKWFERFFNSYNSVRMIRNTVLLSLYSILWTFPIPIILALLINQVKSKKFQRVTQTIIYAPHFISIMILCGMLRIFLSPYGGLINIIAQALGAPEAINFIDEASAFRTIYIASSIWQDAGWGTIIYLATLSSVDASLHEAAKVDGASQFRVMFQINLPMVSNIFFIIFLLQMIGFWGDWQTPMIYLPYNPTVAYALYDVQFSTTLPLSFKPVQLAACVLGSIPTLIAFIFFKNKIMGGLAFGGLKG